MKCVPLNWVVLGVLASCGDRQPPQDVSPIPSWTQFVLPSLEDADAPLAASLDGSVTAETLPSSVWDRVPKDAQGYCERGVLRIAAGECDAGGEAGLEGSVGAVKGR